MAIRNNPSGDSARTSKDRTASAADITRLHWCATTAHRDMVRLLGIKPDAATDLSLDEFL